MTKTAAHFVALAFLKKKGKATPAQIEKHVGAGPYSSKYICYLKLRGYEIETVKSGRIVTEYKYISDGDSATREYKWVPPAQRGQSATPKKKTASVKAKKKTPPAAKTARTILKKKIDREAEALLEEIGMKNAGEYAGGTYSIDPEWDSMDNIDIADLVK